MKDDAIIIEKDIPMPEHRQGSLVRVVEQMEVGDSFFLPDTNMYQANKYNNVARRMGVSLTMRSIDGGVRVWRRK